METTTPFTFDESPTFDLATPYDAPPPDLPAPPPPPGPGRRRPYAGIAALAIACSLVGAVGGVFAGRALAPAKSSVTVGSGNSAVQVQAAAPGSYVAVAAQVLPSVVSIAITTGNGRASG